MTKAASCADDSIPTASNQWDFSWPKWLGPAERQEILSFWSDRFAVPPATFLPYDLAASSRVTYLIRRSPHLETLAGISIQRAGLPFARRVAGYLKPATAACHRFGHLVRKNILSITQTDLSALCRSGELPWEDPGLSQGYVILQTDGHVWGCGLYLEPGRLLCRIPKGIKTFLAHPDQ